MKQECEYCGQYGESAAACDHCGAPIKPKNVAQIAEMDIKKLSSAIAKEINRSQIVYSTDSDAFGGLYQYFNTL